MGGLGTAAMGTSDPGPGSGNSNLSLETPFNDGEQWNFAISWVRSWAKNGVNMNRTALGAETRPMGRDWPHYSIAMHELSHLFGADHYQNWRPAAVVMNYWGASEGSTWYDKENMPIICDFFNTCEANLEL